MSSGTGLVTASYGNRGRLITATDETFNYVLKGRRLRAVCGDHVSWETQATGKELLLTAIEPRQNALARVDGRGKPELLASNLTHLIVVLAPEPAPDLFVADRYLCAAEMLPAAASIIWNKQDLGELPPEVAYYRTLGYPVIEAAALLKQGTAEIADLLDDGVGMLAGQSGVGKSSLINQLIPEAHVATGELSAASREGKHTTTASVMHTVGAAGKLIDSPGVREFAPFIEDIPNLHRGFREIYATSTGCRFSDCQHLREPNCAVKTAVTEGRIAERRYESYKRLCNTTSQMAAKEFK